ncbi:small ribosomal subunit protein mS39 [Hoplias malabaricus]|uniref:small ribosomal subunit protein mS39 n=1 Tax=Hoplias malabaricus TaxID=27720 RepID=UPI00346317B7
MAASCTQVGRHIQKTVKTLHRGVKFPLQKRYFGLGSAIFQQPASAVSGSTEEIVIPRKKTWNKESVLQALASTINRDPTASHYIFQDDAYLTPKTSAEFKLYSLSQESGRNAAKYFINTYPKYFQKDFASPHIPCLMPETLELQITDVSEAALVECIKFRKVKAAVDMYDQLLQAGTPVSLDLTNDLLDLICLYGDRDPTGDVGPEQITDELGEEQEDVKRKKGMPQRAHDLLKTVWRENNNAERIFNMMPERNVRSYGALIRGMVKHGAYAKAFDFYTDLLNNRLTADVNIFNALISAAPDVKEKYNEKWDLITDLLNQMAEQKVKPNLLTFNAVLKSLRRCGTLARAQAFPVFNEMKALGIAPSLATYNHILGIFYKAASSAQGHTEILQDVLSEMAGKSFTAQDPDDVQFFKDAMRICLGTKDIEQAYRVHSLLRVGENWKLLGDSYYQSIYYGRFFNLLCMMEHIDVVLKWYKELIPSLYYPNSQGMRDLLQALDTDNRLDLIPQIWKDIKRMGHDNKTELVEEMLSLMAREKQSPEMQQSFADCALDVKALYTQADRRVPLNWSVSSLTSITSILLEAERPQQVWEMLKLFKLNNRVPSESLMNQILACIKSSNNAQQAVELVQISASFCLPVTPNLMKRVQQEFVLTEEQKNILSDLESTTDESD